MSCKFVLIAVVSLFLLTSAQGLKCPGGLSLKNGKILFGGAFVFSLCDVGFTLKGPVRRRCVNGALDPDEEPECQLIEQLHTCDELPTFIFLQKDDIHKKHLPGAKIPFSCGPYFYNNGIEFLKCDQNGNWNIEQIDCQPEAKQKPCVSCGLDKLPVIQNGHLGLTNLSFDRFEIFCDKGYKLSGEKYVNCLHNSQWSHDFGSCTAARCDAPQVIEGVSYLLVDQERAFQFGSYLKIQCRSGFENLGKQYIRCQEDGTWNIKGVRCQTKELTCDKPDDIENGIVVEQFHGKETFQFDSTITYECDFGFKLSGEATRTCLRSGWSGVAPKCEAFYCIPPRTTVRGVPVRRFRPGEKIAIKCDKGEILIGGSSVLECKSDGTWNSTIPQCKAITCPYPPHMANRRIEPLKIDDDYLPGDTITISCQQGFSLVGGEAELTCSENGEWDGDFPVCEKPACDKPYHIENGMVIELLKGKQIFPLDSTITYNCHYGFKLIGKPTRICLKTGWSGVAPECEGVYCTSPLKNVRGVPATTFRPGAHVIIKCKKGQQLIGGSSVLECKRDGTWNSTIPKCKAISCPLPPHMDNRIVEPARIDKEYQAGDTITISCDPGFSLVDGDTELECSEDGEWEGDFPICEATLNCGIIPDKSSKLWDTSAQNVSLFKATWPWIATILYNITELECNIPICTGSLLNEKWVLTAGSCFKILQSFEKVYLEIGIVNVHRSKIASVVRNKLKENVFNDLVLVELETPATFSPFVLPACLPVKKRSKEAEVRSKGYGEFSAMKLIDKPGPTNEQIQRLEIQSLLIQSRDDCEEDFNDDELASNIYCAGDREGKTDVCVADLGGPFMIQQEEVRRPPFWVQTGVMVSLRSDCRRKSKYSFFQDIGSAIPWIEGVISK